MGQIFIVLLHIEGSEGFGFTSCRVGTLIELKKTAGYVHSQSYTCTTSPGLTGTKQSSFCNTSETLESLGMDSETVVHSGGCHCRKVRWRVQAPTSIVAWDCNCSDCFMRANTHFIVPAERFELLGDSEQFLTTYTFGTHTAKHTFCKVCGITSFYFPRSNPDGVAITFRCVDPGTLTHVEIKNFDGRNWESSHAKTGIASLSKGQNSAN